VTPKQAKRAARSLNYRRRLNEKIPKLEAKLVDFLRERKTEGKISALLGTYKVTLENESLIIEVVDPIDPNQLRFEFYEEVENEGRNGKKRQGSQVQR